MKYSFIIIQLLFILWVFPSEANNLKAFFTYCTFYSPENGPYVETYLSVIGSTISYKKNEAGKLQGSIEVTIIFKQGDAIKNFKKYNLLSPEISDSAVSFPNFIDQQRLSLPDGTYDFELQISDNNSKEKPFTSSRQLEIEYPVDKIAVSDIQLLESYQQSSVTTILTKSGYDLVPYVSNFYPKEINHISFYAEIYNSSQILAPDEKYLVNYFIESLDANFSLNDYRGFVRQTSGKVNVLLSKFNITNLPSGNYRLMVEVRNKTNELLAARNVFFQRSNPDILINAEDVASINISNTFAGAYTGKDTLAEYIRSLRPVSTPIEMNFADNNLKKADIKLMQQFFLSFWLRRNQQSPEEEWINYKEEVSRVQKLYSTKNKRGYETDRGRVFLKYGKPNTIVERPNEPSAYPYEIWHYYKTPVRNNVRFVFYNPDLVTNDYELLHSTAIGEIQDYRWQYRLQKRNTPDGNLDNGSGDPHYGTRQDDFYNVPR